jgi:hypothetical protein
MVSLIHYIKIHVRWVPCDHGMACWWVDNVEMDLREMGWDRVDWIGLAQDRD